MEIQEGRSSGHRKKPRSAERVVFLSFKFDDPETQRLHELIVTVVQAIPRVTLVDGRSIAKKQGAFATNISAFIKRESDCVLCVFSHGAHSNKNILFEAGVAVGAGRPLIIAAESIELVPSMLKERDVICPTTRVAWEGDFQRELQKSLREYLPTPEGQGIADKLGRRYSSEERRYLKDEAACELAINIIRAGDLKKAIGVLTLKIEKNARDVDSLFLLSEAHYLRGFSSQQPLVREEEYAMQLQLAEQALVLDEDNILCLNAQLMALMRLGELKRARPVLKSLLALDGNFSVGLYSGACLGALCEDKTLMVELLERAIIANHSWKDFAKSDPDFTAFKYDVDWQRLIYA